MGIPSPPLISDNDLQATLPLGTGAMQRFPESCQRLSLAQTEERTDLTDADEQEHEYPDSQRELSPSYRFYDAYRSRRISESSIPLGQPLQMDTSFGHSQILPPFHSSRSVESFHPSGHLRRSSSATLDLPCELPALSDCDSMSSASSEELYSPDGPWHGPRTSIEPPDLPDMLPSPIQDHLPVERSLSPAHRSPSPEVGAADLPKSMSDIDLNQHPTFSKVVVTKFSNPPRYRLKKVKFHQCPICRKSFPRPSGLRTHMNMHTNSRPYTCPHEGCDKSFSVISNAKRHYRTHLVEFPPEQIGLPSGPYTINFSDPVVVPDFSPHLEAHSSSKLRSPSIFDSSLSTSSPSSFENVCSTAATSLAEPSNVGCPTSSRLQSGSRGTGVLVLSEEGGPRGQRIEGTTRREQGLQIRPLRWLPTASGSHRAWRVAPQSKILR